MTFKIPLLLLLLVCISCTSGRKENQAFEPNWESMKQYEVPDWFRDAKFGIYYHWGVYSVPAFKSEWYPHWMYVEGNPVHKYHVETYGSVNVFGYKDFIPMFRAEKFNAEEWAELFKEAGARFAGPVAEHADGFAMWDSRLTRFDAMDMGPKKDLVGEMEQAVRAKRMKFIATFHHQWLWGWYPTWDESSGTANPEYRDLYGPVVPSTAWGKEPDPMPDETFCERWKSRVLEVIDKYQPDLLWFDSKLCIIDEQYRLDFLTYYYNKALSWDQDVVVTYKGEDLKPWAGVLDLERARMSELTDYPWLTDVSVDWGSWCDVQNPDYKTANRMIDFLVDVVSKNGCVLLNITPTASGEIPEQVRERLLEIGAWLKVNGEAIYDTRPWKVYGEGPTIITRGHLNERDNPDHTAEDIRFTSNGNRLYVIILDVPETLELKISSLNPEYGINDKIISGVSLLGTDQTITWETSGEGLQLNMEEKPDLQHAIAFRIDLKE